MSPRIIVLMGNIPLLGQERANIETATALRDQGCEVLFLIRREYTQHTIQAELARRGLPFQFAPFFACLRYGQPVSVWLRNVWGVIGGSLALLYEIRRFRATHLHVGGIENVFNFLPALACTRVPLVFRAGDAPNSHHWLWRRAWRYACARAHVFVCDSHYIRNEFLQKGVAPERLPVIYAPPPTRTSTAPAAATLPRRKAGVLTMLYVGQITKAKGVEHLVSAVRRLIARGAAVRLLLAGDYSWNNPFAAGLIAEVEACGVGHQIQFLGFVEQVATLYGSADLHVCPSLCTEAYGLTVVEAKQHGVASVVYPSGGLVELVSSGIDGTVCADKTSAALEEALSAYIDSPELLRSHGTAARESVPRLGLHDFAPRWAAIYARTAREAANFVPT